MKVGNASIDWKWIGFIVSWYMYYLSCDLCVLCNSSMAVALGCILRMDNVLIDFIDTVSTLEKWLDWLYDMLRPKLAEIGQNWPELGESGETGNAAQFWGQNWDYWARTGTIGYLML
jgi:hypothetical protein